MAQQFVLDFEGKGGILSEEIPDPEKTLETEDGRYHILVEVLYLSRSEAESSGSPVDYSKRLCDIFPRHNGKSELFHRDTWYLVTDSWGHNVFPYSDLEMLAKKLVAMRFWEHGINYSGYKFPEVVVELGEVGEECYFVRGLSKKEAKRLDGLLYPHLK